MSTARKGVLMFTPSIPEEELERSEAHLRSILEHTSEGILLISSDDYFLALNQRFCDFFGLERKGLLGSRPGREILQQVAANIENVQQFRQFTHDAMKDAQHRFSTSIRVTKPQLRDLEVFAAPVYNTQGQHLGRLFVYRDVTREREIDRLKTDFILHVSHELRVPVTAIKGYIDLFVEGNAGTLSEVQQNILAIVQHNTDQLTHLLNDLLDTSYLESGRIELRHNLLNIVEIIESIGIAMQGQFQKKQQVFSLAASISPPLLSADAGRISQVFTNLLSNANRYTPPGGTIAVYIKREHDAIRIDVQDTGIGLTPDEQAQIFTRFYRARNPAILEVEGTGLGLTISRSIVELHGGTITVSSIPNVGSTFSVLLPIQAVQQNNEAAADMLQV